MSLTDKIFMGAGSSALPMRAPAGVGGDMASSMKPQMQMAPGMPKPAMGGGLGGKAMQAGRAFNAPVQNKLGTMEFKNLQTPKPSGLGMKGYQAGRGMQMDDQGPPMPAGLREPGTELLPPPQIGQASTGENTTRGFSAYVDEQIGTAGFKESDGKVRRGTIKGAGFQGGKVGTIIQSGAFKGKTRDEAQAALRAQYAGMNPEQRAAYESKGNFDDIADAKKPTNGLDALTAKAMATPSDEEVKKDHAGILEDPMFKLKGVDAVGKVPLRRNVSQG